MMVLLTVSAIYLMVVIGVVKEAKESARPLGDKRLLVGVLLPLILLASVTVVPMGILLMFILAPFVVFSAGVVFTINGGMMLHRESKNLGNSLSLLLGVGLLGVSFSTFLAKQTELEVLKVLTTIATVVSLIVLISFLIFLVVAYVSQRLAKSQRADYLIVLGCGLINNQVTPLLKSRLDRAIELFHQQKKLGVASKFVVSGGQGIDEMLPEAEAMKNYLILQGIDKADILVEDQAINTYENMLFSKRLIEGERINYQAVFVSNNFHVFRSGLFAKQVGLDAKGVGSQTASYYLPSAMLREFVAVSLMGAKELLRALKRAPRETAIYK